MQTVIGCQLSSVLKVNSTDACSNQYLKWSMKDTTSLQQSEGQGTIGGRFGKGFSPPCCEGTGRGMGIVYIYLKIMRFGAFCMVLYVVSR